MTSNLQRGRNVVANYLYIAKSIQNLTDDIENISFQDFNAKYSTKFASEYNFQKSIYRLHNTYFKAAKKNSIDYFYKIEIKTALENRKKKKPSQTDWEKIMTNNFPKAFDSEYILLYKGNKSNNAFFGFYMSLMQKAINPEDLLAFNEFYEDLFVNCVLSLAIYLKCSRTDRSFSFFFKKDIGQLQLRFFYDSATDSTEHVVQTKPLDFYFDVRKQKYVITNFAKEIEHIFKKKTSIDKRNIDENNSIYQSETSEYDIPEMRLKYVLIYSYGTSNNMFDERHNEIGLRESIFLRY
jgi:hypothetical protein